MITPITPKIFSKNTSKMTIFLPNRIFPEITLSRTTTEITFMSRIHSIIIIFRHRITIMNISTGNMQKIQSEKAQKVYILLITVIICLMFTLMCSTINVSNKESDNNNNITLSENFTDT